jgi:AcrR family transcriptional regulator
MSAIVSFLSHFIASGVSIPFVAEARRETALGLRERKKQRTRATLIDAAVELCDRQGFERTTVDQIAAIADVSPRTFSRYFATKDAIAVALIDDAIDLAASELARQPSDINHFEALRRSYIAMYRNTTSAPPGGLSADRMMCTVRIIMTSPTLRQAALEYRPHAVNVELAKRLGVDLESRRLKLVSAVWGSIIMTALADLAEPGVEWESIGIEDVVTRLEATFAEFMDEIADVRQPV